MSFKRLDSFTAICDWPDCGADVMDPTDYSGWGEVDHLIDTMDDYDWWKGADGASHYCDKHPASWASDTDAERPAPPYLLIHDGDTDNGGDDGRVTLIRPVTEVLLDEGNVPLPEVCS